MIPVRKELGSDDPLRVRFGFHTSPMMIVLGSDGEVIGSPLVGGGVDSRMFKTNVHADEER